MSTFTRTSSSLTIPCKRSSSHNSLSSWGVYWDCMTGTHLVDPSMMSSSHEYLRPEPNSCHPRGYYPSMYRNLTTASSPFAAELQPTHHQVLSPPPAGPILHHELPFPPAGLPYRGPATFFLELFEAIRMHRMVSSSWPSILFQPWPSMASLLRNKKPTPSPTRPGDSSLHSAVLP